jgi:hypothetical protein
LPLIPPRSAPVITLLDDKPVEVLVPIREKLATRTIAPVAVTIRGPAGTDPATLARTFKVEPGTVEVVLHGPQLSVQEFDGTVTAYVEVHGDDTGRTRRDAAVLIDNVPEGIGVAVKPAAVQLSSEPQ